MNKPTRYFALISAAVFLAGCGGGGGGGKGGGGGSLPVPTPTPTPNPGPAPAPVVLPKVPFGTPRQVATIDPLEVNSYRSSIVETYAANITGSGGQDVLLAGRMSQPASPGEWSNNKISFLAWENGNLVDKTAQWFPDNKNVIFGTEPSLKFADFNGDGRIDFSVAPSSDSPHYGPASVFFNEGNRFTRVDIPLNNVWSHDSAIGDFNRDGVPDIIFTDYGPNTTIAINDRNRGFRTYTQDPSKIVLPGGSSVAAADFMNNNTTSIIVTDVGPANKLYESSVVGNYAVFKEISTLPTPRFDLPKWAQYDFGTGQGKTHTVRAVAHDFNDDKIVDAILFSRPSATKLEWSRFSEIQFLKNHGGGKFTDETDNVLIGYNTNTVVTYNPKFVDLNNDGLIDILVSGQDFDTSAMSHQFLIKTTDGKYVAKYQNVLTDFLQQVAAMQNAASADCRCGQLVNLIRSPDGKLYLLTNTEFMNGTDKQYAVYLSELTPDGVLYTAKDSVAMLKQAWPYLTDGTANESLAKSGKTYLNGTIIDLDAAFRPIGGLNIALDGRMGELIPLTGWLAGVKFDESKSKITVVDSLRRDFTVDVSPMAVKNPSVWHRTMNFNQDVHDKVSQVSNFVGGNANGINFNSVQDPNNPSVFTVGTPAVKISENWRLSGQFTSLNFSPWVSFGGAWGKVTGSTVNEFVAGYRNGNFVANTGVMYSQTQIEQGIVQNVSGIWALWGEVGVREQGTGFGAYVGIKPWVVSGDVTVRLPTSIDRQGKISYSNEKLQIENKFSTYVRLAYTTQVTKRGFASIGGILFDDGAHAVIGSVSYKF